jgi:hypothetical protein
VNPCNVIDMNPLMTPEPTMLIQHIRSCVLPHSIIEQFYRQGHSRVLDSQSEVKGDASAGVHRVILQPIRGNPDASPSSSIFALALVQPFRPFISHHHPCLRSSN